MPQADLWSFLNKINNYKNCHSVLLGEKARYSYSNKQESCRTLKTSMFLFYLFIYIMYTLPFSPVGIQKGLQH